MNDMTMGVDSGVAVDAPIVPKTRAQKEADWKNVNRGAYAKARDACCTCTPTRAQMLMVEQFEGRANIPVD